MTPTNHADQEDRAAENSADSAKADDKAKDEREQLLRLQKQLND
jgi:hypothetical protein